MTSTNSILRGKFCEVVGQSAAATGIVGVTKSGKPSVLQKVMNSKATWTQRAVSLVSKNMYSYFRCFVPHVAIKTLDLLEGANQSLRAVEKAAVLLLVDISGFTRLSDRFQGLGQEGIDALTTNINLVFSVITNHVELWGGDVVKFAGDAVIVIWDCEEHDLADTMSKVISCALELEKDHGFFKIQLPSIQSLAFSDQLNRHFAAAMIDSDVLSDFSTSGNEGNEILAEQIKNRLENVPLLKGLDRVYLSVLAKACRLTSHQKGDVILAEGAPAEKLCIVHCGMVTIYASDPTTKDMDEKATTCTCSTGSCLKHGAEVGSWEEAMGKYGEEIDSFAEGQLFGDVSLLLKQACVVNAVAATNCSIINIGRDALMSLLGSHPDIIENLTKLLTELRQSRRSKIQYLRIHQSISCGKVWLAHMGGEQLKKPHDYGHRREFLVMGKSILETAEALQEAEVGTLVVSKAGWHHVKNEYETVLTPLGNYKILGRKQQGPDADPASSDRRVPENMWGHHMKRDTSFKQASPVRPAAQSAEQAAEKSAQQAAEQAAEQTGRGWTLLRCYCHEGARDLQEIASFAADVRKMTVMFVLLDLNLEDVTLVTVQQAHEALLTIQRATYSRNGTLRQFIQDDKGLLAICIMGFPPFTPHENDATRAVLVGMEIRESLRHKFSMRVSIGITTGTGYSGFVGSSKGVGRREMCAMGSIVNMAARLMCKAGDGILVDRETRDLSTLMVVYLDHDPIRVKGRDEPLEVFRPLARNSQDQVRESALEHIRRVLSSKRCFGTEVRQIADKVLHYFDEVLSMGDECSWQSLKGVCHNLFDNQHIALAEDGAVVSSQDLRSLSKIGLTRAQLLSRGCFEDLSPPVPIHVQMLAKIVCFLSHETFVSLSLARHVYRSSFPNFEGLFNESMAQLETYGIIKPASIEDVSASMLSLHDDEHHVGCRACLAQWGWVTPAMRDSLHAHIFNFKTRKNAHMSAETIMRSPGNSFSESFSNFLKTKEGDCNLHQVFVITRAELVLRLNDGLLETYKRLWHRYAGEYYDDTLPLQRQSSQIILAHHWTAAVDYESPDPVNVKKAVLVLQLAANGAIEHNAYYEALEYLQRACRLLDRIPMQANMTEKKLELLAEMAPFTIHVYGHGSVESMSAYSGLQKRIPKSVILDDAAVQVLSGLCINLYGKSLYEVGYRVAQRIITSAKKSCNAEHLGIGFASIVPWHYHIGEFDIANVYLQKLYEALDGFKPGGGPPPRLVNGVYYGLVIASVWPTALLMQGKVTRALEVLDGILPKSDACAHPPSQCYVLANIAEFFAFAGDPARCEDFAARAVRLADRYRLAHCRRRASGVLAWVTSQGIRDHLVYLQELSTSGVAAGGAAEDGAGRRAAAGRAGLRDAGNGAMHGSVFGCSQSNSLLHLQTLAFRGCWAELEGQMAGAISAAVKSGTFLLPELLRLNCAVLLATGQECEREAAGAAQKHARVRECFARCTDMAAKRSLALFCLLGATDWLCFERRQCQASGRSASDTLLLALAQTEQALEALPDADSLPIVGVARGLVAQYDSEVRCAVRSQAIMGELLEHYDAQVADNLFEMLGAGAWTASGPSTPSSHPRDLGDAPGWAGKPGAAAAAAAAVAASSVAAPAPASPAQAGGLPADVGVELEAELAELRCIMGRAEVAACLAESARWGQDPFALHRATGQRSLQALVLHALEFHGCVQALRLDPARLARFLREVARGMPDNPYHNAVHCASVAQGMHALMASGGLAELLAPEDRLAGLLAAAVHDFEHQGLNNDALVRMGHAWALQYNDTSPNENHHLAAAFALLRRPDCDFMREMPPDARARLRRLVIDQVLATDMKEHPRFVTMLHAAAAAVAAASADGSGPAEFRPQDREGVSLTLCAAIKVCDIGHISTRLDVHVQWSRLLEEELFRQGDLERSMGLSVSALMDRTKEGITKKQDGFFKLCARPLVTAFVGLFPKCAFVLPLLDANAAYWASGAAAPGPAAADEEAPPASTAALPRAKD